MMIRDNQLNIDDALLNAFVDNQLDAEEKSVVLAAMEKDADIRERIYRLHNCKDWVRAGFDKAEPPRDQRTRTQGNARRWLNTGIAASLMLMAVGLVSGLSGYWFGERHSLAVVAKADPYRVLLHLDSDNQARFRAVLDYTENFLDTNAADGAAVELLVNASAINLIRSGVSPYEDRIRALAAKYPSLHVFACASTLSKLRDRGIEPKLILDVDAHSTAVEHVVERLREGWTYQKVDRLPLI
jgi:intracellular sulfur oxidation DsrE/DsrF family protein